MISERRWYEILLDVLLGFWSKEQLRVQTGDGEMRGEATAAVALSSFHAEPQPPAGVEESRDLMHCEPELQRRFGGFKAEWEARTGRQLFVTCTWRSCARQEQYFREGRAFEGGVWVVVDKKRVKTNVDGRVKKGRHNVYPSQAVDVAIDTDPGPGKHLSWAAEDYALFGELALKHGLRWGGDWNGNGRSDDERFVDRPHLELPAGVV